MSRPSRIEQRRARRALFAQAATVVLALVVVSAATRRRPVAGPVEPATGASIRRG
ncbi:hypothetical protein [Saccharomonospora piscinae]|uniref:hypothetical protein n=1 Tax=Saccharomonospora piscinae TaxID=687388 RepID=UPI00141E69A6|nr:hypothetical protein [Saccharomonospora piscinae]